MTGLERAHERVRSILAVNESQWLGEVEAAIAHFRAVLATPSRGVYEAPKTAENEEVVASSPIFTGFYPQIEALRSKHMCAIDLTRLLRTSD